MSDQHVTALLGLPVASRSHRVPRPVCEVRCLNGQPCRGRVAVGQTRCVPHRRVARKASGPVGIPVRGIMVVDADGRGATLRLEVGG